MSQSQIGYFSRKTKAYLEYKDFLILSLDEEALKLGNKDFCAVVKNPEKPVVLDKLTQKQKKTFNVLAKYCPKVIQIKVTDSSQKKSNAINKKIGSR